MFALVLNGKVMDTSSVKFVVHKSMEWYICDKTVKPGFIVENDIFIDPTPVKTYKQLRRQMHKPVSEQLDMLHLDLKNGTDLWVKYVDNIKTTIPKPEVVPLDPEPINP